MSGHNAPSGPLPHRAPHPAIAAAAAIILLALAACASTTTATMNSAVSAPSTASFGASGHRATLNGAGSTFDAPFFDLAFAHYHQQHPSMSISYAAVGSGAGIAAFSAKQADFGASDVPMTASEQAAAHGGRSVQVPVALGAEVVAYHLDLPGGARLHLTGPIIAKIFLGQITNWDDPAIAALNPGIDIPSGPITVVHRSDGSGTTYIFSNYLSTVSPTWAAKVGTGKTLNWPVGEGAEGNAGVGSTIYMTPFSPQEAGEATRGSATCGRLWAGEDLAYLTGGVEDEHIPGGRVGPPPAEGGVERQAGQDRGGQDPVHQRDPALGLEHRVAEGGTGAGLAEGEREHDGRGEGRPADAGG